MLPAATVARLIVSGPVTGVPMVMVFRPLSVWPVFEVSVYPPGGLVNVRDRSCTLAEILTAPTPLPVKDAVAVAELGTTAGNQLAALFQSVPGPIQVWAA